MGKNMSVFAFPSLLHDNDKLALGGQGIAELQTIVEIFNRTDPKNEEKRFHLLRPFFYSLAIRYVSIQGMGSFITIQSYEKEMRDFNLATTAWQNEFSKKYPEINQGPLLSRFMMMKKSIRFFCSPPSEPVAPAKLIEIEKYHLSVLRKSEDGKGHKPDYLSGPAIKLPIENIASIGIGKIADQNCLIVNL